MLSARGGINWSTGGHSASDITLHGYAKGSEGKKLKSDMAGNWDNTQLPLYIEDKLKLEMLDATKALRKGGTKWVGRDIQARSLDDSVCEYHH